MSGPLNVLIVDDTITYRSILTGVVESIPNTKVAGTANNGKVALSKLGMSNIDLVLLDIEMPELDGLETLKIIHRDSPHIGVVMVSGMNRSSADVTIRALEMGALDFIPKPDGDSLIESKEELHRKLSHVFKHFQMKRSALRTPKPPVPPLPPKAPLKASQSTSLSSATSSVSTSANSSTHFDVLAIGISTGGPNALSELIPALPGDLGVPVLLVQHMPPIFTESLANSLKRKSKLDVKEATHGEIVNVNTVYIAPGGKHMAIMRENNTVKIVINEDPPENSCRPAVDVLFRSISKVYGKNVLSVVMTGMGSDGALGVKALKQVGCYSLIQSEKTCVVYGMPKAVAEMKLADESVELNALAERITHLIKKGNR